MDFGGVGVSEGEGRDCNFVAVFVGAGFGEGVYWVEGGEVVVNYAEGGELVGRDGAA